MVNKQNPGHGCNFACAGFVVDPIVVVVIVVVVDVVASVFKKASITQQDPSSHSASVSTLSHRRAKKPLTHSPLHGFLIVIFGFIVVIVVGCFVVVMVVVATVVLEMLVGETIFGLTVGEEPL